MKINKFKTGAAAAALLLSSGGAMAASITTTSGTFNNFGGFDWASNGSAIVDGYNPFAGLGGNSTFDLSYFADASEVTDIFGNAIVGAGIDLLLGNYEYTILATLNETSTCTSIDLGGVCDSATFAVNSGSFDIWYDTSVDADLGTGAGITDGELLISGIIGPQGGGGFDIITGGNATLQATVTYTNGAYINPLLLTSTAATTLQIGGNITNWTAPTSMPSGAGGTTALPGGSIVMQADGNQSFIADVSEPGSLALLGLSLLGLAFTRRHGKKA